MQIEKLRLGIRTLHDARLLDAVALQRAGDDFRLYATWQRQLWNFRRCEVTVARLAELGVGGQVQPQLEAAHEALLLLRHFAVDYTARCGHPLHAATFQPPDIAHVILVTHAPLEHIDDGFEAAVRMWRKAGDVLVGIVGAELVEHQERIEAFRRGAAKYAGKTDAGAIGSGAAGGDGKDFTLGHVECLWSGMSPE